MPSKDGPISSRSSGTEEADRARQRRRGDLTLPALLGIEADPAIADQARANVEAAGLSGVIRICTGTFQRSPPSGGAGGVGVQSALTANGSAMKRSWRRLCSQKYRELGNYAKGQAKGWKLWLLSGNRNLTGALRLKAEQRIPVSNGGIDCRWLHYDIR